MPVEAIFCLNFTLLITRIVRCAACHVAHFELLRAVYRLNLCWHARKRLRLKSLFCTNLWVSGIFLRLGWGREWVQSIKLAFAHIWNITISRLSGNLLPKRILLLFLFSYYSLKFSWKYTDRLHLDRAVIFLLLISAGFSSLIPLDSPTWCSFNTVLVTLYGIKSLHKRARKNVNRCEKRNIFSLQLLTHLFCSEACIEHAAKFCHRLTGSWYTDADSVPFQVRWLCHRS